MATASLVVDSPNQGALMESAPEPVYLPRERLEEPWPPAISAGAEQLPAASELVNELKTMIRSQQTSAPATDELSGSRLLQVAAKFVDIRVDVVYSLQGQAHEGPTSYTADTCYMPESAVAASASLQPYADDDWQTVFKPLDNVEVGLASVDAGLALNRLDNDDHAHNQGQTRARKFFSVDETLEYKECFNLFDKDCDGV